MGIFVLLVVMSVIVSMKAQILQTEAQSKRIKIRIAYHAIEWRTEIKKMAGIWYHRPQKLWSVPNTAENLMQLKIIFRDQYDIVKSDGRKVQPKFEMTSEISARVQSMHSKLILSGKRASTVKAYQMHTLRFFKHFEKHNIGQLTKEQIEQYIYMLKMEYKIGDSSQNVIINAIKFYLEKVLGLPREKYDLTRPKKALVLPDILSESDCYKLINALDNIKHRSILHLMYSAGLRRGEITKLRITDIRSDEMMISVKSAKGKKDRTTVLSETTLSLLRVYVQKEKLSYWLFEGQDGGQYSASSIAKLFR